MDKRVEIHGTTRADINGKRGVATDFHWYDDQSKWRYTVQLDSGDAFELKPANVRTDKTGHLTKPKEKEGAGGKGKKGRGKKKGR